jgi:Arc/MetJ-type ribon-helix-helix transcriptional regulator
VKVSVSLPDEDVEFLDAYALSRGVPSRSAVVQRAIHLLRASELGSADADAWEDWEAAPDAQLWEATIADGLSRRR